MPKKSKGERNNNKNDQQEGKTTKRVKERNGPKKIRKRNHVLPRRVHERGMAKKNW